MIINLTITRVINYQESITQIILLFLGISSDSSIYITDLSLYLRIIWQFFTQLTIYIQPTQGFYLLESDLNFKANSLFYVFPYRGFSFITQKGASTYYLPYLCSPFSTLSCAISLRIAFQYCSTLSKGLHMQSIIFNFLKTFNAKTVSDFYMQLQEILSRTKFVYFRTWTIYASGIRLLERSSYCSPPKYGNEFNVNSSQSASIKFCNLINYYSSVDDQQVKLQIQ